MTQTTQTTQTTRRPVPFTHEQAAWLNMEIDWTLRELRNIKKQQDNDQMEVTRAVCSTRLVDLGFISDGTTRYTHGRVDPAPWVHDQLRQLVAS